MKKILYFAVTVLIGVLILGLLPVHGEEKIYSSVIRFHVLANSDTAEDQALKLKVRDRVLECASEITEDCTDRAEALERLNLSLDIIRDAADEVIRAEGYDYSVSVTLGEEDYPTRSYESVCFPAGRYMSLRVLIGEAEGQNWWCVLFPNLCRMAAGKESAEEALLEVGLTPEQYRVVTETEGAKYKVRFKLLEIISETFGK